MLLLVLTGEHTNNKSIYGDLIKTRNNFKITIDTDVNSSKQAREIHSL